MWRWRWRTRKLLSLKKECVLARLASARLVAADGEVDRRWSARGIGDVRVRKTLQGSWIGNSASWFEAVHLQIALWRVRNGIQRDRWKQRSDSCKRIRHLEDVFKSRILEVRESNALIAKGRLPVARQCAHQRPKWRIIHCSELASLMTLIRVAIVDRR